MSCAHGGGGCVRGYGVRRRCCCSGCSASTCCECTRKCARPVSCRAQKYLLASIDKRPKAILHHCDFFLTVGGSALRQHNILTVGDPISDSAESLWAFCRWMQESTSLRRLDTVATLLQVTGHYFSKHRYEAGGEDHRSSEH